MWLHNPYGRNTSEYHLFAVLNALMRDPSFDHVFSTWHLYMSKLHRNDFAKHEDREAYRAAERACIMLQPMILVS
jgi:hypothetical protein